MERLPPSEVGIMLQKNFICMVMDGKSWNRKIKSIDATKINEY